MFDKVDGVWPQQGEALARSAGECWREGRVEDGPEQADSAAGPAAAEVRVGGRLGSAGVAAASAQGRGRQGRV
eukprot:2276391-Alexandrium_andersonii.AAC.1